MSVTQSVDVRHVVQQVVLVLDAVLPHDPGVRQAFAGNLMELDAVTCA